ncbi:Protein kinase domain-containing protein [Fusarium sp. LHS14.1]|nr:Protein kinase domain-containing protein [Fusarium sp. LHS14.1]
MEAAGLAFAVVGAVDLCIKYGREVRKIRTAFKGAEPELEERALKIEIGWHRCFTQLDFLKSISHLMDETHQSLQERTLRMLSIKLDGATHTLQGMLQQQTVNDRNGKRVVYVPRPFKYAMKEKLDEAIDALNSWQQMSDPSWFLLMRMHSREMSKALTTTSKPHRKLLITPSGLSLPAKNLYKMDISCIPFSDLKTAKSERPGGITTYVLDELGTLDSASYQEMEKNIRNLARRLQHNEPQTFGLLCCKGFVAEKLGPNLGKFTIVSRMPPGLTRAQSLRQRLLQGGKPGTLSQRFSIAQELAKSVSYVHVFGFVHKNIRPETILDFDTRGKDGASVFLLGFEDFRQEGGRTRRRGDDALERNLYRHPSRQGIVLREGFLMQHDIYSLGVCLLEIGLWQSFVNYEADEESQTLSPVVGVSSDASHDETAAFLLTSVKDRFVKLAQTELRECMGTRYSEIVETCLTCLDPGNNFGDQQEFQDKDGIRVGVRYIEKVGVSKTPKSFLLTRSDPTPTQQPLCLKAQKNMPENPLNTKYANPWGRIMMLD